MGSAGSMLESGGFSEPAKWHTIDYIDGYKVLAPKDENASISLPSRSNTPGTTYVSYRKDGTFDQIRKYKDDRTPEYDIDYGTHRGKKSLHVHFYHDGKRSTEPIILKPGDKLYDKYIKLFKGVTI